MARQAVVEPRPRVLVFGKHMVLGLNRLRIVQGSRRDANVMSGAMKSKRATTIWTKAPLDVLRRLIEFRFAVRPL